MGCRARLIVYSLGGTRFIGYVRWNSIKLVRVLFSSLQYSLKVVLPGRVQGPAAPAILFPQAVSKLVLVKFAVSFFYISLIDLLISHFLETRSSTVRLELYCTINIAHFCRSERIERMRIDCVCVL